MKRLLDQRPLSGQPNLNLGKLTSCSIYQWNIDNHHRDGGGHSGRPPKTRPSGGGGQFSIEKILFPVFAIQ
jgi:hypothetical protein